VAELLGSAIGGLFNKAKRLHACKGPSRHAAAFQDVHMPRPGDIITNKKKKLLDAFHTCHVRRQPSLDSQYRYITSSNSYLFKLRYLKH
jgi:hypothetical protein